MSWIFAALGLAIVLFTLVDLAVTTLTMEGAGPASNPVSHFTWRCFRKANQLVGWAWLRMMSGPATLILLLVFWLGCVWLGWVLVFSWDGIELINVETQQGASFVDRVYYVGYTITTIGYGDFRVLDGPGRIASVFAGFTGLFLLTLSITYAIQVLTAVVEKRKLALLLGSMKTIDRETLESPYQRLQRTEFAAGQLASLHSDLAGTSQKYLAYPVIHAFNDRSARVCLPVNIKRLYTFLTMTSVIEDDLPAATCEQLEATRFLIRVLIVNAMSSHWHAIIRDKSIREKLPGDDDAYHEDIHQQPLDTVLMAFVESSGWGAGQSGLNEASV